MSSTLSSAPTQERENHLGRARALALRASALLNVEPKERVQMHRAIHSEVDLRISRGASGLEVHVAEEMRMIESHAPSLPPPLWRDLLDAALEFDDAAESAALDSMSLNLHLADYLATAESFHRPDTIAALKALAAQKTELVPKSLPVLPTAMMQLLRSREESVDATTLCRIASADQVLTARLLGVANSVYYGSKYPITRLLDATLRVGVPMARKVLLEACAGGVFASSQLRHLWRHSRTVAAATAELACAIDLDDNLAYATGLLHDIGRVYFSTVPNANQIALSQWLDNGFPLVYAETLAYGLDHASAGAALLRTWGVPDPISDAVEMHHSPELSGGSRLPAILFLAEVWSQRRFEGELEESLNTYLRLRIALEQTGLPEGALQNLGTASPLYQFALAG